MVSKNGDAEGSEQEVWSFQGASELYAFLDVPISVGSLRISL